MERCGEGRDTRRGNDLDEHTASVVEDKELKSGGGGGGGGPRHQCLYYDLNIVAL